MEFNAYLHKQTNSDTGEAFKQNTIHGRVKVVKQYVNTAYQADLIKKKPEYKVPKGNVHREALSIQEIKQIEQLHFDFEPELERSKDVFLFSCYTAIRFSDIKKLTKKDIKENGRLKFISEKTDTELELPLDKLFDGKPLKIIRKYFDEDTESLFSVKTNQAVNRHLKVIRVAAKIDKPLSFHIARHTCLTVLGKKTGNPYLLMRIAGHSDIKTSMQYTKGVVDDDLFKLL